MENFQAKADCVADFYSQYTVNQDGGEKLNVNGRLTLGENIADMGGVRMSLAAYRAGGYSGSDAPAAESLVPNLTNEQMFFVSFAQIWCAKQTPQALRKQVRCLLLVGLLDSPVQVADERHSFCLFSCFALQCIRF